MARDTLKDHLSKIGKKGGKAAGKRKARGDSAYYSQLGAKRKPVKSKMSDIPDDWSPRDFHSFWFPSWAVPFIRWTLRCIGYETSIVKDGRWSARRRRPS